MSTRNLQFDTFRAGSGTDSFRAALARVPRSGAGEQLMVQNKLANLARPQLPEQNHDADFFGPVLCLGSGGMR